MPGFPKTVVVSALVISLTPFLLTIVVLAILRAPISSTATRASLRPSKKYLFVETGGRATLQIIFFSFMSPLLPHPVTLFLSRDETEVLKKLLSCVIVTECWRKRPFLGFMIAMGVPRNPCFSCSAMFLSVRL